MEKQNFIQWKNYFGRLFRDGDERQSTQVFGFENFSEPRQPRFVFAPIGSVFGFVQAGEITILSNHFSKHVCEGEYFCMANGGVIIFNNEENYRVLAVQSEGFLGINTVGGPIEARGRLQYIDTCSDTLLVAPPMKGEPCFNHLHFPHTVDQTMHTHPSLRAGIVARGGGVCVTPEGEYPLLPGVIFSIPTDGHHKFRTADSRMDIIAYHPDSDFGPTHETHPMINRTWVDGVKVDNTQGIHTTAEFIAGRFVL